MTTKEQDERIDAAIRTLADFINRGHVATGTIKSVLQMSIEDTPGGVSAMKVLAAFVNETWEQSA